MMDTDVPGIEQGLRTRTSMRMRMDPHGREKINFSDYSDFGKFRTPESSSEAD